MREVAATLWKVEVLVREVTAAVWDIVVPMWDVVAACEIKSVLGPVQKKNSEHCRKTLNCLTILSISSNVLDPFGIVDPLGDRIILSSKNGFTHD